MGWGGFVVLLLLSGGVFGFEFLLREVIFGFGFFSGVGFGLYRGGGDLEVFSDVVVLGFFSDRVGLGVEIIREEVDLD